MKTKIFESNPNLKEVHMTSDGQCFYNEPDAKLHAKSLEDKAVELVMNPKFIAEMEVVDEEELNNGDVKISEMKPAELVAFAKEKFDVELKANTPKPTLVKQVSKLIESANAPAEDASDANAPTGDAPAEDAPDANAKTGDTPAEDAPVDGGTSVEDLGKETNKEQ